MRLRKNCSNVEDHHYGKKPNGYLPSRRGYAAPGDPASATLPKMKRPGEKKFCGTQRIVENEMIMGDGLTAYFDDSGSDGNL